MSNGNGYIYVTNWENFQHYKTRNPPWIKLYTNLVSDDDYLDLSLADRCLLTGIWMLTAKHGQGRVQSDWKRLLKRLSIPFGTRSTNPLPRLVDAGFITISAIRGDSTALAPSLQSTERDKSTPSSPSRTKKTERARTSAGTPDISEDENGQPLTRAERQAEARRALEQIQAHTIKDIEDAAPSTTPSIADDDELI